MLSPTESQDLQNQQLTEDIEYKRPLSNAEIVPKFRIEASLEEALVGVVHIRFVPGQRFDLGKYTKYDNFVIDAREIQSPAELDDMKYTLKQYSTQIYGFKIPGCRLNSQSIDEIVELLTDHGRFQYLVDIDLSYIPLSENAIKRLSDYLDPAVSGYCPLKRVQLCHGGLHQHGTQSIFNSIRANVFVNELNVSGNHCSDSSCKSIAQCLENPENRFFTLSIAENNISLTGMLTLCPPLSRHTCLQTILLNSNFIGDEGASVLFRALKRSTCVEEVHLSNCGLVHCKWAKHLKYIAPLCTLNVSCNSINDFGCLSLCNGLQECPSIRHINMASNQFGGPSCAGLGVLLESNGGLYSITISYSVISKEVWIAIAAGLSLNTTLLMLDLQWCNVDLEIAALLCEALEQNDICTINLAYNPLPEMLLADCRAYCPQLRRASDGRPTRRRRQQPGAPGAIIPGRQTPKSAHLSNEVGLLTAENSERPTVTFADGLTNDKTSRLPTAMSTVSSHDDEASTHIHQKSLHPQCQQLSMMNGEAWREDAQAKLTISLALQEYDEAGNKIELQDEVEEDGLEAAMKDEHIRVVYGNFQEEIGVIRIHGGTTYDQAKHLIRPLISEYMGSVDQNTPSMQELLSNFSFLNKRGEVIDGSSLKSRCVLPDVVKNQHTLIVRPGNWLSLPETNDEPALGQYESI